MDHVHRYAITFFWLLLSGAGLRHDVHAQSIIQGMVGHWTFDNGTLADSSGNGFSGTLGGTGTQLTTICGVKGDAVQFPGDGTLVEFNNGINTYFSTADITISFWFRIPANSGIRSVVSKRRNNHSSCCYVGGSFDTRANNSGINTEVAGWPGPGQTNPPATNYNAFTGTLTHGCWHHYTFTRNGWDISLYIDGVLRTTATSAHSIHDYTNANSVLGIGNGECYTRSCSDQSFNGAIDELRVYSRALNAQEVQMLFLDPLPYIAVPATDTSMCADSLQLSAVNYSCGMSVAWEPAALMNAPASFSPVAGFTPPSQTAITAAFSDQWGCLLIRDTVNVEALPAPEARILVDTVSCATLAFKADYPSGTPGTQYDWWFGDGNTGAGDSVVHVYASGGQYTIILRVTNPGGCVSYDTVLAGVDAELHVDLGPDTAFCDTELPFILTSPQPPGTHYLWSNGLSDTAMEVVRSGMYWLVVESGLCTGSDTIYVHIVPTPSLYIGRDTIICEQFPLRTGGEIAGASYAWSTGELTPYIHVYQTGVYVLEANLEGCIVRDTIEVVAMPEPEIDLGGDRDICPEEMIVLDATYGTGSRYLWSTGETTPAISVTVAGSYAVQVITEHRCTGSDSIILTYYPKPIVSLGADTTVCEETPLLLIPRAINADSFLWSDGSTGRTLEVRHGDTYVVTAANKCGTGADTIMISQIFCNIWVPNAFTPDGDGLNDILRAVGNLGRLEHFSFSIFNRWGERIFYTQDKYQGWNGTHDKGDAQVGTYVYMLEYSFEGKPYLQKGSVHLLR